MKKFIIPVRCYHYRGQSSPILSILWDRFLFWNIGLFPVQEFWEIALQIELHGRSWYNWKKLKLFWYWFLYCQIWKKFYSRLWYNEKFWLTDKLSVLHLTGKLLGPTFSCANFEEKCVRCFFACSYIFCPSLTSSREQHHICDWITGDYKWRGWKARERVWHGVQNLSVWLGLQWWWLSFHCRCRDLRKCFTFCESLGKCILFGKIIWMTI